MADFAFINLNFRLLICGTLDTTLKFAKDKLNRSFPEITASQQDSVTSAFHQVNHCTDSSPIGAGIYTMGDTNLRRVRQMCATLPNNVTPISAPTIIHSKSASGSNDRNYMTLKPELHELEYPYGRFKQYSGVYHQLPQRINTPKICGALMKCSVDGESPSPTALLGNSVEMLRDEQQKRCSFKLNTSPCGFSSIPGTFDTAGSIEGTIVNTCFFSYLFVRKLAKDWQLHTWIFGTSR